MKVSLYNNYVVHDGRLIIYNSKTMSSISFNSTCIEDVNKYLDSSNDKTLFDLGFITDEHEIYEMHDMYNAMKYAISSINIMVVMTYACNCTCKYCFENVDSKFFNSNDEKIIDTLNYIYSLIKKNNINDVTISFFGGEPLLIKEKIVEVVSFFHEKNISPRYVVITNGTLLTREVALELYTMGVMNYQITIDGVKDVHDKRRPLRNSFSCYDTILKNLESLKDLKLDISIRINLDSENINELELIVKEVKCVNPNVMFYLAVIVGCLDGTMMDTLDKRANALIAAWKLITEKSLPIQINPPVYAPCPYHSRESAFYIDIFGNVYTCGGFVGDVDKIERTLEHKTLKFYNRIAEQPNEACFSCSFFPICMGGCRFETNRLGHYCQKKYLKVIYDEYFTKYAKQKRL